MTNTSIGKWWVLTEGAEHDCGSQKLFWKIGDLYLPVTAED